MVEPRVSVAIAVHNEEAVLPELVRRLTLVLDGLGGGPHEVVFEPFAVPAREPMLWSMVYFKGRPKSSG